MHSQNTSFYSRSICLSRESAVSEIFWCLCKSHGKAHVERTPNAHEQNLLKNKCPKEHGNDRRQQQFTFHINILCRKCAFFVSKTRLRRVCAFSISKDSVESHMYLLHFHDLTCCRTAQIKAYRHLVIRRANKTQTREHRRFVTETMNNTQAKAYRRPVRKWMNETQ